MLSDCGDKASIGLHTRTVMSFLARTQISNHLLTTAWPRIKKVRRFPDDRCRCHKSMREGSASSLADGIIHLIGLHLESVCSHTTHNADVVDACKISVDWK